jgi:DNA helicase-2/ATP-dependent DNA helicase PcrA
MTLDDFQKEIVWADLQTPLLVSAPPGYGKTFVMSRRIGYLIRTRKISPPKRILGFTFTNAAKNQMVDSIVEQLGALPQQVEITTFHAWCYNSLRAFGNYLKIKNNFKILPPYMSKEWIKIEFENEFGYSNSELLDEFKDWKIKFILRMEETGNTEFKKVWKKYFDKQTENNTFDFDSILLLSKTLLEDVPEIYEHYANKYGYIIIDEFQDTNPLQYYIFKKLVDGITEKEGFCPVCIVGDKYQSIFQFQGSEPSNMEIAIKDLKCKEKNLVINYRTNNPTLRKISEILREINTGEDISNFEKIPFYIISNKDIEAQLITMKVKEILDKINQPNEMAIISAQTYRLDKIRKELENEKIPLVFMPDFTSDAISKKYQNIFNSMFELIKSGKYDEIGQLLEDVIEELGLDPEKDMIVDIILRISQGYSKRDYDNDMSLTLHAFYNELLLDINLAEWVHKYNRDKVILSSIHGVKGLQFNNTFLVGVENFLFPHTSICWPCMRDESARGEEIQEELNKLNVALSRTRDQAIMSSIIQTEDFKKRGWSCIVNPIVDLIRFMNQDNDDLSNEYILSCSCWAQ